MAKQSGEVLLEGTYGNLTCYKMEGQYYVRRKSSLTSKKFWKHKSFEGSRKSCKRFGEGNELASKLYQKIDEEKRAYKLFCFLKKRAIALLKEGKSVEEAEMNLMDHLVEFGFLQPKEDMCIPVAKGEPMHLRSMSSLRVHRFTVLRVLLLNDAAPKVVRDG